MDSIQPETKELVTYYCGCHGNLVTIATRYVTDAIAPRNLHNVLVSNFCVEIHNYNLNTWWSEGITIVGRITSRDAQSNGQIFLSHRVLHIFRTTAKSYREQSLFASALKFITERWKVQKYVLFLEFLKLNVNCSCVPKENTKQKKIIHLVSPRTLQNKAAETIFWILESKNVLIASIGNSVFDDIDNVKS